MKRGWPAKIFSYLTWRLNLVGALLLWPWVFFKASKAEFINASPHKIKVVGITTCVVFGLLLIVAIKKYQENLRGGGEDGMLVLGAIAVGAGGSFLFIGLFFLTLFSLISGVLTYYKHRKGIINPVLDAHQQSLNILKDREHLARVLPKGTTVQKKRL